MLEVIENQVNEVVEAGNRLKLGFAQDRSLECLGKRSLNLFSTSEL